MDKENTKRLRLDQVQTVLEKSEISSADRRFFELYADEYLPHTKKFWKGLPNENSQKNVNLLPKTK